MPIVSKTTLKNYFKAGARPTQSQFADLIDSTIRDALKAIADGVENDNIRGLVTFKSAVSVTSISTAALAKDIRDAGNLLAVVTGANGTFVGVSGGNFVSQFVPLDSVRASAQTARTLYYTSSPTAWDRVATTAVPAVLMQDATIVAPEFKAFSSQEVTALSGISSVSIETVPAWATRVMLSFASVAFGGTRDIMLQLSFSTAAYVSAGYVGAGVVPGGAVRNFDGNFILAVAAASPNRYSVTAELVTVYNTTTASVWAFRTACGEVASNFSFGQGSLVDQTSGRLLGLRIRPHAAATFSDGTLRIAYGRF